MALIDLEIQHMLEKEAIHVVPPEELHQGFVNSIFLVPKKRGGQRPVVNLPPPPPQSVHPLRTFQNGGDSYVEGSVKKRGLYGQDRPE